MDERNYYRKKIDKPPHVGEYVYSVVPTKQKLGKDKVHWQWKIVVSRLGSNVRVVNPDGGGLVVIRDIKPQSGYFHCNANHLPLPQFIFNRKKEAEGWLKLVTEGRLEV